MKKTKVSYEESFGFWFLLGPSFLMVSLFLSFFSHDVNHDLWAAVFLGCFACYKFPKKGIFFAWGFLALSMVWKHFFVTSHHLWQLGLEGSLAVGFWLTYVCFGEGRDLFKKSQKIQENLLNKVSFMEETYVNQQEDLQRQLKSNDILLAEKEKQVDVLTEEIKCLEREKKEKESFLIQREKEKAQLEQKIKEEKEKLEKQELQLGLLQKADKEGKEKISSLMGKISLLEEEQKKIKEKTEAAEKRLAIETQFFEEKNKNMQEREEERKRVLDLYNQLKNQFAEKGNLLHQARVELFHAQEDVAALKKEQEMQSLEEGTVDTFEEDPSLYEKENKELLEIVLNLGKELELATKKKRKKVQMLQQELPLNIPK